MLKSRRFVYLTFLLPLFCLSQQYSFKNIGADKGFEDGASYYVSQDSRGYIWICSNGNLLKYNGRSFKSYKIFKAVYRSFEDETGRLFYFPSDCKPGYVYNDSIFTPPFSDTLSKCLDGGRFFINDFGDLDNERFIISTQKGFYSLDKKTLSKFNRLQVSDTASFHIKLIHGKAFGAFYHVTTKVSKTCNIYNLNINLKGKELFIPVELEFNSPGPSVFKCLLLNDGRVLVGFYNKILVINTDGSYYYKPINARLTYLYQDPQNTIWIGYYKNGLDLFENADLNKTPTRILPDLSISSVFLDNEGGTWLSTLENNIFYCPGFAIQNFMNVPELGKNIIALNNFQGSVMCSNDQTKLFFFPLKKNWFGVTPGNLPGNTVGLRAFRYKNKIYYAGRGTSFVLDTNFKYLKTLEMSKGKSSSMYNITLTKNKELMGLSFNYLFVIRNDSLIVKTKLPARGKDICTDNTGQIYIGTNEGLFLEKNDVLVPFEPIRSPVIRLRCFDDMIYVTTDDKGVFVVKGEKIIDHFSDKEGLPSGGCNDVALDENGNSWIGTNEGLYRIDKNKKVIFFDDHYGLVSPFISQITINKNEVYMLTAKGLCRADINTLKLNATAPRMYIDSVLNNGTISYNNSFNHLQNNFLFYVEGLSYFNTDKITFQYRMKGLDSSWHSNVTGQISFTNLDPGLYAFEVYCISASNIKSSTVTYHFTIISPFWLRWWFVLLEILVGMGLIYLFIQWRINIVRKQEEEKTELNKLIAEHQMSAIRAQMNPHFIFNSINSIQHYILSNETQYAYDYLARFSKLVRKVLLSSEKKDTFLKDEVEILKLYLDLEKRRFKDRFDYKINYNEALDDIKIPALLIQPFAENAIWHGFMELDETIKGKLLIDFSMEDAVLIIKIEDNGIGREESQRIKDQNDHVSLGMTFTQKRLDLFRSLHKKEAKLEIIDLKDNHGKAIGTRVNIQLTLND